MAATETIDREAGDSGKGFRLQLIRAIKLMLNSIKQDESAIFFTAVENVEDISHQVIKNGNITSYYEEDKNYDVDGNFTIFSPPVTNTLVSFFDIYVEQFRSSNSISLGFYTTRNFGKERKKELNDGSEISLPSEPILGLLTSGDYLTDEIVTLVKDIIVQEYTCQYEGRKTNGNLDTLKSSSIGDFRDFLGKIIWHFGQEDEAALKQTVLKDIESSPLHNNSHIGKENIIFCLLMDKLSEKQNSKNLIDKLVHSSDVKLIFKEAESQVSDESIDPTWRYLSELEREVSDKRNLKEKILAVIGDFPDRKIQQLERKASSSKYEEIEADKTFLSLKYRVFEACAECFLENGYHTPKNVGDMEIILQKLISCAMKDISTLKADYKYSISNEKTIEGIVLNLIDSCFLAFDEIGDD